MESRRFLFVVFGVISFQMNQILVSMHVLLDHQIYVLIESWKTDESFVSVHIAVILICSNIPNVIVVGNWSGCSHYSSPNIDIVKCFFWKMVFEIHFWSNIKIHRSFFRVYPIEMIYFEIWWCVCVKKNRSMKKKAKKTWNPFKHINTTFIEYLPNFHNKNY